jgi:hypothetical protein
MQGSATRPHLEPHKLTFKRTRSVSPKRHPSSWFVNRTQTSQDRNTAKPPSLFHALKFRSKTSYKLPPG